jgi:hypothetical protein
LTGTQSCDPNVVRDDLVSPSAFNLVGSDLYFQDGGEIRHLSPSGELRDVTVDAGDVVGVRVQAPYVYFTRQNGMIARALLDGSGSIEPLTSTGLPGPWDLLIVNDTIYFSSYVGPLASLPMTGGTPTPLLQARSTTNIEIDADYIYVSATDAQIGTELVTGIVRIPFGGGAPEPVHRVLSVSNFFIVGSDLYLLLTDDPIVYRAPGKTGTPVAAVDFTSLGTFPNTATFDADYLYITAVTPTEALVARAPLPAGDPEVVFRYGTTLHSIEVDGAELVVSHYQTPAAILRSGKCPCE